MPITIAEMAANTGSVDVQWGENTVTIKYYPSQVTEETLAVLDKGEFQGFNEELEKLIKSWDVLDNDGSMYPTDPEHLAKLPLKFRLAVAREFVKDIRPND